MKLDSRKDSRLERNNELLVQLSRLYCSRQRWLYCSIGPSMLLVGVLLVLYPLAFHLNSLNPEDLAFALFGTIAIATGWAMVVFYSLSQMAYEILLRLEGECEERDTTKAAGTDVNCAANTLEIDSNVERQNKEWLRQVSTRNMSATWRVLVLVPLVVGVGLLVLTFLGWLRPKFGDALPRDVPLEYLCLGGLVSIMGSAYLMLFGAFRAKRSRTTTIGAEKGAEKVSGRIV